MEKISFKWCMFVINMRDTWNLLLRCPFPRIKAMTIWIRLSPFATHIGVIWSCLSLTTVTLQWQGNQGLQELSSSSPQLYVLYYSLYWPMWGSVNATRVSLGLGSILSLSFASNNRQLFNYNTFNSWQCWTYWTAKNSLSYENFKLFSFAIKLIKISL